ncbi:MAG: ImpA family type VI secretion system protein [Opitutaceae bacterium]
MIEVDQLLQPFAGTDPSGIDVSMDSRMDEIRSMIEKGSEDSPTDWKKVKKLCLDLLSDGRELEVLISLTVAGLMIDGFAGLRDGLVVLSRSINEYWDSIHPQLDEEEPEDERYIIRQNLLAQLGEAPCKIGDPFGILEKIYRTPLTSVGARGAQSYWAVFEASEDDSAEAAQLVKDWVGRMELSDRDTLKQLLIESSAAVTEMSEVLMQKTGIEYSAPFDEFFLPGIKAIVSFLESISGSDASVGTADAGADSTSSLETPVAVGAAPAVPVDSGAIRSSADVIRALDKIVEFYRKTEPSSPVPFILARAKKLVDADFMSIISNLNPDSEFQFKSTLNITESE